jgi:hypothetical protein
MVACAQVRVGHVRERHRLLGIGIGDVLYFARFGIGAERRSVYPDEARAFAERLDAIREGDGERLTEDDVVRALEQAIRKGSVTADPRRALPPREDGG